MKRLLLLLFMVGTVTCTVTAQTPAPHATQHDKAFLLEYYQQTFDNLQKAVEGLSETQMAFQAAPDKWSVSQCLEHIILTEKMLLGYAQQTMDQQPNPEKRNDVKISDEDLIRGMTDRSHKAQAPKELAPKEAGKYNNATAALQELSSQRTELMAYIDKLSTDDMRNHITDSPFGPVDGYHSLLYIPAHTARHTLQIEEIKADKNFPMQ